MPRIVPAISVDEPALTAVEALVFLGGICRKTLERYCAEGHNGRKLVVRKIGGKCWFLESDLRAFVSNGEPPAEPTRKVKRTAKVGPEVMAKLRRQGFKV